MKKTKEKKIKNSLKRYEEFFDEKLGTVLINDFMQLSHILESLKEIDNKAFNAFYALISKNIELEEIVKERGSRIAKLQRGQTQPK